MENFVGFINIGQPVMDRVGPSHATVRPGKTADGASNPNDRVGNGDQVRRYLTFAQGNDCWDRGALQDRPNRLGRAKPQLAESRETVPPRPGNTLHLVPFSQCITDSGD
jgi:hypothetical protein